MSRTVLLTAAATVALIVGSLPTEAAMPVSGAAQIEAGRDVLLVQAPATGGEPKAATTGEPKAATTTAPKAKKKTSRQKEIDQSVESGTVPKRYRSSIPKQYQDLIPWSK